MIKKPLQVWKANTGLKVMLISQHYWMDYKSYDNEYWYVIILEEEKEECGPTRFRYSLGLKAVQNINGWSFPKVNFFYTNDRLYHWELSEL